MMSYNDRMLDVLAKVRIAQGKLGLLYEIRCLDAGNLDQYIRNKEKQLIDEIDAGMKEFDRLHRLRKHWYR